MFFHLGRIVSRHRWLIVGLWIVAIAIALPFAPQATQVLRFVSPDFESERAITLLAQKLQVHSVVWMDHQWGNFLTLGGGGWVWFSIQLNNDTEMMLYLIRDATGKTISTYVEYVGPQADVHLLPPGALRVDVLDNWKSPANSVNYPSGWHLKVNNQQFQPSLTLTPELKDQELVVYQSTGNSYWEGAVSIQGQSAGQVVQGEGYVELTGYTPGS